MVHSAVREKCSYAREFASACTHTLKCFHVLEPQHTQKFAPVKKDILERKYVAAKVAKFWFFFSA
jgi:hypothetical protein